MAISLSNDSRKQAIQSIKQYFVESDDEGIGELKATLLLEFFLVEIAPSAYNQGVADAQAYFQDKVADLDGVCYEPEFGHWK